MRKLIISVVVDESQSGALQADLIEKGFDNFNVGLVKDVPWTKNRRSKPKRTNKTKTRTKKNVSRYPAAKIVLSALKSGQSVTTQELKTKMMKKGYKPNSVGALITGLLKEGKINRVATATYTLGDDQSVH